MLRGIIYFLIPAVLSGCCYLIASLAARFFASQPRRFYIARLVIMLALLVPWWFYWLPYGACAYAGNLLDGDALQRFHAKHHGAFLGSQVIWAWVIVALIDRPKKQRV